MEGAKIQLSDAEMALVQDAGVILTKNHILQQTRLLLEAVQAQMQASGLAAHPLLAIPPKISRGENYLGLPYLVLDYPRNFGQPDLFAIRSFFWWGHFFSSTLQLSGVYQQTYAGKLVAAMPLLAAKHYFIQTGPDPWAHHFEPGNYQPVASFSPAAFAAICHEAPQIKIAAKWPLESWPFAATHLFESWQILLDACWH